jgi:hypothetical protein
MNQGNKKYRNYAWQSIIKYPPVRGEQLQCRGLLFPAHYPERLLCFIKRTLLEEAVDTIRSSTPFPI